MLHVNVVSICIINIDLIHSYIVFGGGKNIPVITIYDCILNTNQKMCSIF